jgi:hypothetical protein
MTDKLKVPCKGDGSPVTDGVCNGIYFDNGNKNYIRQETAGG